MRRAYRRDRYLAILDRVRATIPDAAITTDIIVGFPGESERDFEATLKLVADVQFDQSFCFLYSRRPGTPAASLPD
jgi:tRNA-2-methylthio-N6-dimethylallyladenosine synthase